MDQTIKSPFHHTSSEYRNTDRRTSLADAMVGEKDTNGDKNEGSIDANSPFYIHASDYPKQMHVNDLLNDHNYTDWSQEMMNFLFAKNKVGFIDGSLKKPEKNSSNYMPWMRCDAMLKGWLTTAMEKEIRSSVKYVGTAREIWADLDERFGKESAPRAFELKHALATTQQSGASVSAYYTKLGGLWDEIGSVMPTPQCTCNGCNCDLGKRMNESKEKERLYEFLMGLDDEFTVIKMQILATKPIPSLSSAYHLVAEDERQRAISHDKRPTIEAAAVLEVKRDKGNARDPNRNDVIEHCTFCGKDGHKKGVVSRRSAIPNGGRRKVTKVAYVEAGSSPIPGLTREQYQTFLLTFAGENNKNRDDTPRKANIAGKREGDDEWAVDSGATEHITYDPDFLNGETKIGFEAPIAIADGTKVPVRGRGNSTLKGGTKIDDVLYVPNFSCNLLSVRRLTNSLQSVVSFFPDFCVMQSLRTRSLIGAGRCEEGLYRMRMVRNERKAMAITNDTWHKRLGHATAEKLNDISFRKNIVFNELCDSCFKAKHTRLPFSNNTIKTIECFNLLHCDIWGKYRTPSFTGANYFLTIVDDFSRAVWLFLLKFKHEASGHLKLSLVKTLKELDVIMGGEFTSKDMMCFYKENGILLETTCPHTPQQNGTVERKHRHLLETARALRFEASLPKRFWGECVLTAAYIINRLPSKVIGNKTPFELLHNEAPDYNHLKVFGCLAYYRNTDTRGDKFEEGGELVFFLGYPPGTKGYKIYDLENKKIIISRDNHFPSDSVASNSQHDDIFEQESQPTKVNFKIQNQVEDDVTLRINEEATYEGMQTYGPPQNPFSDPPPQHEVNQVDETNESPMEALLQKITAQAKRMKSKTRILNRDGVNELDINRLGLKISKSSFPHPLIQHIPLPVNAPLRYIPCPILSLMTFLTAIHSNNEPRNFAQAMQDERWREAMKREIRALEENGTWILICRKEKQAIVSKWVYKVKYRPNGEVERYKARLVAKGFTQQEGVDYHDTFAPVAKLVTVRTLLAVAVKKDWIINQLDVNNAFLHGDLDEEVYMKIPHGFSKEKETRVCKLKKSLYGLKQASRNWYQKFTTSLLNMGFKQCKADYSLFIRKQKNSFVAALIYVDDVIIVGNDRDRIQAIKNELDKQFSIKDLGNLKYFLGIEVTRTSEGLVLSQRKYTLDILEDCGLQGCRPSSFPMEPNLKLDKGEAEQKADNSLYRRMVGRLLYLQATRPDITYAVKVLSQFVSDPRQNHLNAAHRVLRYLKATVGQGILLSRSKGYNLTAYCDSDWLGCPFTRRSRTGYLLLLGGAPVSWKTKKQSVVSRSSAEAEYRSMASTVSEILWMRWLLQELDVPFEGPTPLFCDNQAARHIANNPVFHERTKHVEMDCYCVRERVETQEIHPLHVDSKLQIADLFTKGLAAPQLSVLLGKLGVVNLHTPT
ncbi:LOW QUALITY PROTEIN: hypothetical protein OSB04_028955 [Centaurea solstitialis]|uniref:Integrase catalytic domain-containing protein n=1 Tax=Centaurea solstitialis TaxID=347529 RepID=A0AA38W9T9_9ASTR|nr:LOW QUALITY PROTEIN: hypothetical protein OSB04_028955 [Centaurea solstitialis]